MTPDPIVFDFRFCNAAGFSAGIDGILAWGVDDCYGSKLPESYPFVLQPDQDTLSLLDCFLAKVSLRLGSEIGQSSVFQEVLDVRSEI